MYKGIQKLLLILILITSFCSQAYALNLDQVIETLPDSQDYVSVHSASTDIHKMINAFDLNNPDIAIDWNNFYKIYVDDNDIFSYGSQSKADIMNTLDYIWCYMDTIDNRNFRVTISKATMPDRNLVSQGVISDTDYQALVNRAGSWVAPEAEMDTTQTISNIESALSEAGISETDDIILVGGTSKMRSLFAITFSDNQADKIIPLARNDILVNTDAAELASNVSSNELEFGEVYDFSEVAQILNKTEISPTETGGVGTSSAITESNAFVIVGFFPILILSCGILIYLRRKQL